VGTAGSRTINAVLDNQGTITFNHPLALNKASAAHTNSGTINVIAADWTLNQSGTGASFTNTGTVTIGTGRTWTVNSGTLNLTSGAVSGVGTLALAGVTANFANGFSNSVTSLALNNSILNGPGTITNATGQTQSMVNTTVNAPLVNQGLLVFDGTGGFTNSFTAAAGSTLRLQGSSSTGVSNLTITNGFTNNGTIDLTTVVSSYTDILTVTNGTLTNAPGATITSSVGTAGSRTINAVLDNQGTITFNHPLALNKASAAHTNSGTINVIAADWTLNQSGTGASFTNTGTVTIGTGRTWTVNGGTLNLTSGAVSGAGTLGLFGTTANFATGFNNSVTSLVLNGSILNGPGTVTNTAGQTQSMINTTVNAPLVNQGLLVFDGTGSFTNSFTAAVGSTLRLQGSGTTGVSNLTITNGFTNNGVIDLTTVVSSYTDILTVTNGTLTNAPGATITSSVGTAGSRTINAVLDNQGTITFNQPLALNKASAAHTNSGTINVIAADWTLNQSGSGASFTNTGTVTIGTGRTWTVNGGTLNLTSGAVSGAGTLGLFGTTANFATGFSNSVTSLVLNGSILNGPGTVTNTAGQTQSMVNTTVNAPLVNQGVLVFDGTGGFTNTFTAATGSTLRLQASGSTGVSNLTITNGFTNNGTIDLTTVVSSYTDILTVTNGTLTNAVGATILSTVGTGGSRTINAVLDNQGTITFNQPLALNKASAAHSNSGTITLAGADWTLNQSGTGASFTNTGTVAIGTGRTWTVNGGTLNLTSGTVSGAGTLALFGTTANFAAAFNNSVTALALNGSTINGPGTVTNASGQTLSMTNTTVNAPLANQGLLVYDGTGSFTNTFTTVAGSTLRLQASGSTGTSNLTIANGFTNFGAIELTTIISSYTDILTVTSGSLTNAPGATLSSLAGTGGTRTINASVNNQGTLAVATGGTGLLTIVGGLSNTGSIALKLGGTTAITQYDRLAVTGTATLAGTLDVTLVNNFVPSSTNTFSVLTTTTPMSGRFGTTNLPPGITNPPTYNSTSVVLVSP
jgi:cytochrome c biogenesis protein ResB